MDPANTTAAVQGYLDQLKVADGDAPASPIIRELLSRAANRLRVLSASYLYRHYPRLRQPPLNLQTDEMLSAVVERLLKALTKTRPGNVRQFFALANQHMRWELNELARRLELEMPIVDGQELVAGDPQTTSSSSGSSANTRRILAAIDELPANEREVFGLVRVQGLTHGEVAEVLRVSTKTVQRRLNHSLVLLAERLGDLSHRPRRPAPELPD